MRKIISYAAAISLMMGLTSGITVNAADDISVIHAYDSLVGAPKQIGNNNVSITLKPSETAPSYVQYYIKPGNSIYGAYNLGRVQNGDTKTAKITYKEDGNTASFTYSLYVLPEDEYKQLEESVDYWTNFDSTYAEFIVSDVTAMSTDNQKTEKVSEISVDIESDGYLIACINGNGAKSNSKLYLYDFEISDGESSTDQPTAAPTEKPTAVPTEKPTEKPTVSPTEAPAVTETPDIIVEAETSAMKTTGNTNPKIQATKADGAMAVVYYANASVTSTVDAPGAIFKLKKVSAGDKVDIDINYAKGQGGIEYSIFTSSDLLELSTITAAEVRKIIPGDADINYKDDLSNDGSVYKTERLIDGYTADKDGDLYLYIGAYKDAKGQSLVNGKLQNKFQLQIDYFDVNITPAQTVPSDDSEYRTCDGVMTSEVSDENGAPYWTFTKTMDGTSVNAVNVGFKSGDDERIVKCELGTDITGEGSVIFSIFVTGADIPENLQAKMIE